MKLTDYDLKQINDETLDALSEEQVRALSKRLLSDLKAAKERLNQNPGNSSRPSGSMLPWENSHQSTAADSTDEEAPDEDDALLPTNPADEEDNPEGLPPEPVTADPKSADNDTDAGQQKPETNLLSVKRHPGKQEGAPGFGRTQILPVTGMEHHKPASCALCEMSLADAHYTAWTGWYCLDVAPPSADRPGIQLTNTHHLLYAASCSCGHHNRAEPFRRAPDAVWPGTEIGEWRLVGPRLAAMIVLLSKRHRNSFRLIREFLHEFLGVELSVGTISQTICEAGRSVAPLEEELIKELEEAGLVYVDETSWKESGSLLWLWVFRTLTLVYFTAGKRDRTIFSRLLLSGRFKGTVMSDGWIVYREYANRLRCWAHLMRKARGLSESWTTIVSVTGTTILSLMTVFQNAIYAAREQPNQALGVLMLRYHHELEQLNALCVAHQDTRHDKLRAFARELLNDWDIIFRQLQDPVLPLTNNEAERVLRHWVIDRRLSHGTRTPEGTRSLTLLASVIETCRIRGAPLWEFLTNVIGAARKGLELPCLPAMSV